MHGFDLGELSVKFRLQFIILLIAAVFIFGGIILTKVVPFSETKIEKIHESLNVTQTIDDLTVEISGEVLKPGVYKLSNGSRVDDLLMASGGFTDKVDVGWVSKYLNKASKIVDGQKVYIPALNWQSNIASANESQLGQNTSDVLGVHGSKMVNINTASLSELDSLPGIGQVYGQNVIDHRPYSNTEELLSKGVLKKNLYEKIKEMVSVY